jgi:Uncharacterized protein involved in response to NO
MAASPAILRGGFRPFFLLGATWAVIALVLWMLSFSGGLALPSAFDPLMWHRHEMLFGFVGAVVAGFLLTAIPNWTGRLPIAGWPLAGLVGLWAAGRISVLCSAWTGIATAATVDVGFYFVLAGLAAREVMATKNRSLPVVAMVFLIGLADVADHAGAAGLLPDREIGMRAGISIVVMLISLIGGRIIPSFTRNWMTKQGITRRLPTQPTRYDLAVVISTGAALLSWTVAPDARSVGALLMAVGAGQVLRLSRWGGLRSARDPLVFILHLGYFWVPAGLLMLGASIVDTGIPRSAAIHALTAGAMPTMILAVMTRAILGHTGRQLAANSQTVLIYVLITLGALVRVATPLGILDYSNGMQMAALMWAGAFVLFLIAYGPILFRPSLGQT